MTVQFKDIEQYVDHVGVGVNSEGGLEVSLEFRDNLTDEEQMKIKEFAIQTYQMQRSEIAKEIVNRAEVINNRVAYRRRTMGIK